MTGGHAIRFDFEGDYVHATPVCREPADADCRATPRNGCECESYTILRAADGTPYHRVDTFGGAEVLHWMHTGGPCTVGEHLGDMTTEAAEPGESFLLAEVPITPVFHGDEITWKRKTGAKA